MSKRKHLENQSHWYDRYHLGFPQIVVSILVHYDELEISIVAK